MTLARPDVFHPRIVLAGCPRLAGGDTDDAGLVFALRTRGLHARWLSWDDPGVRGADLVILRATRDHTERLPEFLAWTAQPAHLLNGPAVVAWNADRRYLLDLTDRRVSTVPTEVFAPGQVVRLPRAEDDVVVKPAVGAGARRFRAPATARDYAAQLQAGGATVLVQPRDHRTQTALVFLGGEPSHAFTAAGPAEPDFAVWDVGLAALDAAAHRLGVAATEFLYARAEVFAGPDDPQLLALQLIDPPLGWRHLDADTRERQQRRFALGVESGLQRFGLGPLSRRRP